MIKKEVLTEVIDYLFAFSEENKGDDYTLNDFLGYLNTRQGRDMVRMRKIAGEKSIQTQVHFTSVQNEISTLLMLMYRYAKGYIKKGLLNSRLKTTEEFAFLITLMTYEGLTKTELIKMQVMEKTSGTEVIRRLIQRDYITETENREDKRSKRISITEKGKKEIYAILPVMRTISDIIIGDLSKEEINTLSYLLKKLDYFHNDIFIRHPNLSLDEILELRKDSSSPRSKDTDIKL